MDVRHNEPFTVTPAAAARPAARPPRQASASDANGALPRGEASGLTAAHQLADGGTREQLSVLTGYKRSSRDTYVQRLRERGYVGQDGEEIVATAEGLAALGDAFEPLPTGDALREHWLGRLPE